MPRKRKRLASHMPCINQRLQRIQTVTANPLVEPAQGGKANGAITQKTRIAESLGIKKKRQSYSYILKRALSQDDKIQKAIPAITKVAIDIRADDLERREAALALVDFARRKRDGYDSVRRTCSDSTDLLMEALAEIVIFTHKLDEEVNSKVCELYEKLNVLAELDMAIADKRREMRELEDKMKRAMAKSAIAGLSIAPVIEILNPGLVLQILPYFALPAIILGLAAKRFREEYGIKNLQQQKLIEAHFIEARGELEKI